eukprot:scaffold50706_cov39-Attheya_sp.AAC.2
MRNNDKDATMKPTIEVSDYRNPTRKRRWGGYQSCRNVTHSLVVGLALLSTSALAFAPSLFSGTPMAPDTSNSHVTRLPSTFSRGLGNAPMSQQQTSQKIISSSSASSSPTQLNVWWFGGSERESNTDDDDSCELVAVRIERTSPNSRRIAGDITVECTPDDAWAILTDYDNLAIHVPNLVESRRVASRSGASQSQRGTPGDGQYKCRLYQKGSQKIIGFEFGATVTMDMTEQIVVARNNMRAPVKLTATAEDILFPAEERKIAFKCVDSPFFTEFDGEWRVQAIPNPTSPNQPLTSVSYIVDVRPKGPVPVGALEWRIREDVPTNLRAVKKAAMEVGLEGVMKLRQRLGQQVGGIVSAPASASATIPSSPLAAAGASVSDGVRSGANEVRDLMDRAAAAATQRRGEPIRQVVHVSNNTDWDEDETMAAYLNKP